MESKNQKRKKKLKLRAAQRNDFLARRTEKLKYPTFVYENEDKADPRFVELVHNVTDNFDFSTLPETMRNWYAQIKADRQFLMEFAMYGGGTHPRVLAFMFHMGEHIYQQLGDAIRSWVPFNDIRVIPTGKNLLLRFDGLRRAKGPGGTIYHSASAPKIKFDNKEYTVGFSTHAIEQCITRLVARPWTYAGAGDAFAFFNHCKRYDPVKLLNNDPAFTFFDQCAKGFLSWHYVRAVFGEQENGKDFYRRIGYCPLVFEGDFAKAKTLLPPGYRSTPEAAYLNRLQQRQREEYTAIIETPPSNYLANGVFMMPHDYFEPTIYFHQFVPQVIQSDMPLYERY